MGAAPSGHRSLPKLAPDQLPIDAIVRERQQLFRGHQRGRGSDRHKRPLRLYVIAPTARHTADSTGLRYPYPNGNVDYRPPTATSPYPCTFSQISRSDPSTSPLAVLNASASIVSGAPSTTSGAPYSGVRTACSIVSPPTACTGTFTACTTSRNWSSGLGIFWPRR